MDASVKEIPVVRRKEGQSKRPPPRGEAPDGNEVTEETRGYSWAAVLIHRLPLLLAIGVCFLAWAAYVRSYSTGSDARQAETPRPPTVEEPPAAAATPSEPFVFVDPATTPEFAVAPGVKKKQLISSGRVPYLQELAELELELGAEEAAHTYRREVAVYFGLLGNCELHVVGGDAHNISRGASVTVMPGVLHNAAHPGGKQRCKILRVVTNSGSFRNVYAVQAKTFESLKPVKTAHESNLLTKKVYLGPNIVPGLFQVSLSKFGPDAVCEQHRHKSAAEVYVNYDGSGCHLEMHDWQTPGKASVFNISGGKVAVVNPTTLHRAWNALKTPCQSINMMIGSPLE